MDTKSIQCFNCGEMVSENATTCLKCKTRLVAENPKPFGEIPSKEEYWKNRENLSSETLPVEQSCKAKALRVFGSWCYVLSIIMVVMAVINIANGQIYSTLMGLPDAVMLLVSSFFIASWGALLRGIANLVEK